MSTTQNKKQSIYFARNKDGFSCVYDSETHKCVDIILSTGDNIELFNEKRDEYIGQIDPKYESQ